MDLDRGTLAKIDRRVLSGLGHDESYQMVRVPVTQAVWSTWKRYCDAAGISMGRVISALVEQELRTVVGESIGDGVPVFAGRFEEQLAARESHIASRVRDLEAAEQRLRGWTERLHIREGELRV